MDIQINKRKLSGALRTAITAVNGKPQYIEVIDFYVEKGRVKEKRKQYKLTEKDAAINHAIASAKNLDDVFSDKVDSWNKIKSVWILEVCWVASTLNTHSMLGVIPAIDSNVALRVKDNGECEYFQDSEKYKMWKKKQISK